LALDGTVGFTIFVVIQTEEGRVGEVKPECAAEHLLWLLGEHGVEHLFLNPGTDSAPLQEAAVVLGEAGARIPKIVTSTFEAVAMAAAHGYWQVTRRPQAVFVHVDVGTQNLGAMVHNAFRDQAGVIVIAGKTPYREAPDAPGGRSHVIHWQQDVPDQAGVIRPYAKWSYEITRADILPQVIGRAVQVARSGPAGPVYLTVSRDVLMDPVGEFPGRTAKYAAAVPAGAPAAVVWDLADRIAGADRPLLITAKVGRTPAGFDAVTRIADLGRVRVVDMPETGCTNIASAHPMNVRDTKVAARCVAEADLILVVDCDVPWIPRFTQPAEDATIVHIAADPLHTDIPLWTFPADLAITADGATALGQVADRLAALDLAGRSTWPGLQATTAPATVMGTGPITGIEVANALNAVLADTDFIVEEAVTNAPALQAGVDRSLACTHFGTGSPGLGWGVAGAVGVKMAAPDRRVVTVVGDGSFLFASPASALTLANEAAAPVMVVVMDNDGYKASRLPVFELFPHGLSASRGDAVGTRFAEPPDIAALARACHAYGERVTERSDLTAALRRGLTAVADGRSAVIDVVVAD
jgi:acetolactate synthase-1/2/3 large subunit